ncbi:MAG TPA: YceI family protein [Actinomycetota bacterium]|nr:YceI family protein [Actinomycetota bacterium]
MSETTRKREYQGVSLPPAGRYRFDKAHTELGFVARHMISKVRGRFTEFDGAIEIGETIEDSRVEVEIDAASIWTNTGMRDDHLRSGDFLEAETYPKLTFHSTGVRPTGGTTFQLVGDLTIKDTTSEVVLDAEFLGFGPGSQGGTVVAFTARTEIDREDWDMTWNVAVETGGLLVGKKVQIEIDVEALLVEDAG